MLASLQTSERYHQDVYDVWKGKVPVCMKVTAMYADAAIGAKRLLMAARDVFCNFALVQCEFAIACHPGVFERSMASNCGRQRTLMKGQSCMLNNIM